jgi:hypothetical protein
LVYTIKLKLLMQNRTQESGKVTAWDEEVPAAIIDDFWAILEDMKALWEITFPQCIQPPKARGPTVGWPMLLVIGDSSRETSCALAYMGRQMAFEHEHFSVSFLLVKREWCPSAKSSSQGWS